MIRERTAASHLDISLLIRAADNELADAEALTARKHLAECRQCGRVFEDLGRLSGQIETLMASNAEHSSFADRQELARRLEQRAMACSAVSDSADRNARFILWRFGWSMALAASLAVGVIIAAHARKAPAVVKSPATVESAALEVDGETFIPLPYSNPDLPVSTSRVVEMQVPVSSLSDVGIVFEPVANGSHTTDRTVLADVLIGGDGQPLGVHILGVE